MRCTNDLPTGTSTSSMTSSVTGARNGRWQPHACRLRDQGCAVPAVRNLICGFAVRLIFGGLAAENGVPHRRWPA